MIEMDFMWGSGVPKNWGELAPRGLERMLEIV